MIRVYAGRCRVLAGVHLACSSVIFQLYLFGCISVPQLWKPGQSISLAKCKIKK